VVPVTTFFVWEIFINKNNMNFQVNLSSGSTQEQRIVDASSWSTCLAYCEGTGLTIVSIQTLPSVNIVQLDTETVECYQGTIKVNGLATQYLVWANSFDSFNTWFDTLTNPVLQNLQFSNKLYVTV
jgi:hypothetical protein